MRKERDSNSARRELRSLALTLSYLFGCHYITQADLILVFLRDLNSCPSKISLMFLFPTYSTLPVYRVQRCRRPCNVLFVKYFIIFAKRPKSQIRQNGQRYFENIIVSPFLVFKSNLIVISKPKFRKIIIFKQSLTT